MKGLSALAAEQSVGGSNTGCLRRLDASNTFPYLSMFLALDGAGNRGEAAWISLTSLAFSPDFPLMPGSKLLSRLDRMLSSWPPLSFPGCNRASIPWYQRAMVSGHVQELALDCIKLPEHVLIERCKMYVTVFASPRSLRHWNFSAQAMADVFRTKFPGLKVTRSAFQRGKW